ncbi:MAG: AAA family ATPase, partial [Desulfobacteraceae bacterium]
MSLFSLPSLCASIALVFLIFYAFARGPKSALVNVLLSSIFFSMAYMVCEFLLINTASRSTALVWDKIIYFSISISTANYLHLALIYPKPFKFMQSCSYILALIYLPAVFFIAFLPTDYFIAGMQPEYWGWGKEEGPLYNYFRFYLAIYFTTCILSFAIKRRHADPKMKNGLALFLIAYLVPAAVTGVVTFTLQPMGINKFNIMVHPLAIIFSVCFHTYAIIRQHLLYDIQLLLAPAIKTGKYHFHQKMKALIHNIHGHDFDYKQLVRMLNDTLKCAVGLNINGKPVAACGGDDAFLQFKLEELDQEIVQLQTLGKMGHEELQLLSQATFENFETIHAHLEKCGIEAILPIYDDGQILGTLKFGKGFSEKIYSKQDFQLISALWTQLVVALKYIRKLEEQVALKDNLIEKLNQKIQLQEDHALPFRSHRTLVPNETARAVFISKTDDLVLGMPDVKKYSVLNEALKDKNAGLFILDGRDGILRKGLELKDLPKPLIIIGTYQDVPDALKDRLIDVVAPDRIEERLRPAVHFLLGLHQAVRFKVNGNHFVSASPKVLGVLARIQQAAKEARTMLVTGETGTGKELIACYIGQTCRKKIISVNCAAISTGLFESAFCGHEKGAFTGADQCHRGYLEQADKAILFLDEISELPLDLQAKLLRIIEGAPFQRLGGRLFIHPDVQFICATNRDLKQLVKAGK